MHRGRNGNAGGRRLSDLLRRRCHAGHLGSLRRLLPIGASCVAGAAASAIDRSRRAENYGSPGDLWESRNASRPVADAPNGPPRQPRSHGHRRSPAEPRSHPGRWPPLPARPRLRGERRDHHDLRGRLRRRRSRPVAQRHPDPRIREPRRRRLLDGGEQLPGAPLVRRGGRARRSARGSATRKRDDARLSGRGHRSAGRISRPAPGRQAIRRRPRPHHDDAVRGRSAARPRDEARLDAERSSRCSSSALQPRPLRTRSAQSRRPSPGREAGGSDDPAHGDGRQSSHARPRSFPGGGRPRAGQRSRAWTERRGRGDASRHRRAEPAPGAGAARVRRDRAAPARGSPRRAPARRRRRLGCDRRAARGGGDRRDRRPQRRPRIRPGSGRRASRPGAPQHGATHGRGRSRRPRAPRFRRRRRSGRSRRPSRRRPRPGGRATGRFRAARARRVGVDRRVRPRREGSEERSPPRRLLPSGRR